MPDDDVQLTDLEVIQRYSLAVRGATASREDLLEALQADLDWLTGGRRSAAAHRRNGPSEPAPTQDPSGARGREAPAQEAPARKAREKKATARKAPARNALEQNAPEQKAAARPATRSAAGRPPAKRAPRA